MTRHELKEQIQHDAFTDTVSRVLEYTSANRDRLVRSLVIVAAVVIAAGAWIWYSSHEASVRRQDLAAALEIISAPVGPSSQFGKSFPTEQAKRDASIKALSAVVARDGGTREGLIAQYYLGTLKTQRDPKGAESDLRAVANSTSECAPLAKIALAQLYAGEKRVLEARELLQTVMNKPTDLVSKAQAQILLAQIEQSTNPQDAKRILQALKSPGTDAAVTRAADELANQLNR